MSELEKIPPMSMGEMILITSTMATSYLWMVNDETKKIPHKELIRALWTFLSEGRTETLFHMFNMIEQVMHSCVEDSDLQKFMSLLSKAQCTISAKAMGMLDYVIDEHDSLFEGDRENEPQLEKLEFKCSWQGLFVTAGGLTVDMVSKYSTGTVDPDLYMAVFSKVSVCILKDDRLIEILLKTLRKLPYRDSATGEVLREIGGKKELSESIDIFAKAVPLIIVELEEGEKSLQGMVEQLKDFLMKMPDFKNDGQEYLS